MDSIRLQSEWLLQPPACPTMALTFGGGGGEASPPPLINVCCLCVPIILWEGDPIQQQAVRHLREEEGEVCGAVLPLTTLARSAVPHL